MASPKTVAFLGWTPNPAPTNAEQLPTYLFSELNRFADIVTHAILYPSLPKTFVEPGTEVQPSKPRDGALRYADGTKWNPGSGAGIYFYDGTSWTKL